jgi:hypothetical protein
VPKFCWAGPRRKALKCGKWVFVSNAEERAPCPLIGTVRVPAGRTQQNNAGDVLSLLQPPQPPQPQPQPGPPVLPLLPELSSSPSNLEFRCPVGPKLVYCAAGIGIGGRSKASPSSTASGLPPRAAPKGATTCMLPDAVRVWASLRPHPNVYSPPIFTAAIPRSGPRAEYGSSENHGDKCGECNEETSEDECDSDESYRCVGGGGHISVFADLSAAAGGVWMPLESLLKNGMFSGLHFFVCIQLFLVFSDFRSNI